MSSLNLRRNLTLTHTFKGEHHVQYQYYLNGAQNHYIGLAQTETVRQYPHIVLSVPVLRSFSPQPYYQPSPASPAPFVLNTQYKDPAVGPGSAWALTVTNSFHLEPWRTLNTLKYYTTQ